MKKIGMKKKKKLIKCNMDILLSGFPRIYFLVREEGRGFKITMFSKKFQNFMNNNCA